MIVIARKLATFVCLSLGAYALVVRPRLLRWGATDGELGRPYPGAELIPGGEHSATMAVTIDAPPASVWPWLVQMGADRGGWYSWDRLDNWGVPSAERVHPEWQLVVSGYWSLRPRWLQAVASFLFLEPSHWIMQTRQFANLKRRAERDSLPAAQPG